MEGVKGESRPPTLPYLNPILTQTLSVVTDSLQACYSMVAGLHLFRCKLSTVLEPRPLQHCRAVVAALTLLGSAVAETLAEHPNTPPLVRIGVKDTFGQSATADELLDYYGLTPAKIHAQILETLAGVSK